jgi:hypothetical protein
VIVTEVYTDEWGVKVAQRVERWNGIEWEPTLLRRIRGGDLFRLQFRRGEFRALGVAMLDNGVWAVACEEYLYG